MERIEEKIQEIPQIIKFNRFKAAIWIDFKEIGRTMLICNPNNSFKENLEDSLEELNKLKGVIRFRDYLEAFCSENPPYVLIIFKTEKTFSCWKEQRHDSINLIFCLNKTLWEKIERLCKNVLKSKNCQNREFRQLWEEIKGIIPKGIKKIIPENCQELTAKFIITQLRWIMAKFPNISLYAISPVVHTPTINCFHLLMCECNLLSQNLSSEIIDYFLITSRKILEIIADVRLNLFLNHALRSAIAAIMARNMSHNVGSHAIWYLAEQLRNSVAEQLRNSVAEQLRNSETYSSSDIEKFLRYLQKRMDFIAQVSTSAPSWCLTMKWGDLIEGFTEQKCLLDNIAWSHKVRYLDRWFDQRVSGEQKPEVKLAIHHQSVNGSVDVDIPSRDRDSGENRKSVNWSVDIPHGQIGAQAFYTILENLIRNTAKYGNRSSAPALDSSSEFKKLEFAIKIEDKWDDKGKGWQENYYRVSIRDNWVTMGNVPTQLNEFLAAPIIDPATGELKPGEWGMKEIKICAAYLRMVRPEEIDSKYDAWKDGRDPKEPPMIEVKLTNNDWQEVPDNGYLTYVLYLLRPKEALLVGEEFKQVVETQLTPTGR